MAGARARWAPIVAVAILALLAAAPFLRLPIPGVLPVPLNRPGSMQLLGLCLTFAGVAMAYNLVFGYTGLLSFGHSLYFSAGVYVTCIAMTRFHWSFPAALALTGAVGVLLPLAVGAVALRVGDIAFAMVTLALAQAGSILVFRNPGHLTGGEEGLGLDVGRLPDTLVGVVNTPFLYWIALGYAAVVLAVTWWTVRSRAGAVWQAIRQNERRVEVLGLRPYTFKLVAFTLSGFLTTAGGVVYLLLIGGATPSVSAAGFSLSLLLMVVLGGAGTLWGPALGGVLYEYLDFRLTALSSSDAVASLPGVVRVPLSQPLFILGTLFVLLVLFFPGGLGRIRPGRLLGAGARRRRGGER